MKAVKAFCLGLTLLISVIFVSISMSEEAFTVKRIGNLVSFRKNEFRVNAPEDGMLTIRIHDDLSDYRVLKQKVKAGENSVIWDGCGYNSEKLYAKTYTVSSELEGISGHRYSCSFLSPADYSDQCLQYALPSSDSVSLLSPEEWFLEYRTVMTGKVCIQFSSAEESRRIYEYTVKTIGGKLNRRNFSMLVGKQIPEPGEYRVSVYEVSKPESSFEFRLLITSEPKQREDISVTGEIMPDREMSDEEIWEYMMRPSVVVDIDYFRHQKVYADPDSESRSLGTIHGQTQGLKVLRTEDEWVFIGAWNHEYAEYVEGWVPRSVLKVEKPGSEYGLLIDKQKQTMKVYRYGKVIDTLFVSTGRPERNGYERETAAGCFLTGFHRVDFSTNGNKYDYVIQYDGGNLLHQTPYSWGRNKQDFALGRAWLGAKASHACIRIQEEPGEGGINAYWLWTHLPYHTRVIILDDPVERRESMKKLQRTKEKNENGFVSKLTLKGLSAKPEKDSVLITFTGTFISDGMFSSDSGNDGKNRNSSNTIFSSVLPLFEDDDLTCVPMTDGRAPLFSETNKNMNDMQNILPAFFSDSSVEMICFADDGCYADNGGISADTGQMFEKNGISSLIWTQPIVLRLRGHLFGFACINESGYMKDPKLIDKYIGELKQSGCERIILLYGINNDRRSSHTIVQEAISRRAALAGADLVVACGNGPVFGAEYYGDIPAFFGTGILYDGANRKGTKQGILLRAEFAFGNEEKAITLSVVPVLPDNNSGQKNGRNTLPGILTLAEAVPTIRRFRDDSTDYTMEKMIFVTEERHVSD